MADGLLSPQQPPVSPAENGFPSGPPQTPEDIKSFQIGAQQAMADRQGVALETAQLLKKGPEKIQEMGQFTSKSRLALETVKSGREFKELQSEILQEAVKNDYIEPEDYDKLMKLDPPRFKKAMDFKILQLAKVNNKLGEQLVGQEQREALKASAETQVQKDVIDSEQLVKEIKNIQDGYNPKYFTWKGRAGLNASKIAEKAKGIWGVEDLTDYAAEELTGKSPKERAKYLRKATTYLNSVEQFFQKFRKKITGAQAAVQELNQLRSAFLSGDMAPSEFRGALDQISRKANEELQYNKEILRKGGIDVRATRQYYRDKGWSDERIDAALKKGGF